MKKTEAQQADLQVTSLLGRVWTPTRVSRLLAVASPTTLSAPAGSSGRGIWPEHPWQPASRRNCGAGAGEGNSRKRTSPLPFAERGGHVPRPLPGGRGPGRRGCPVEGRKRPRQQRLPLGFLQLQRLSSLPLLPRPRPRSAKSEASSLRFPRPLRASLPREGSIAGTPGWGECWKHYLCLRFKRLNS